MMSGTVGFLTVQPRTAIGSGVVLEVDARFVDNSMRVVTLPAVIGPFLTRGTKPNVRIVDQNSGGLFTRQKTSDWHSVEVSDQLTVWTFPEAPWAGGLQLSVSWAPGAFDAPNHDGVGADERVSASIDESPGLWTPRTDSSEPVVSIKPPKEGASAKVIEVSGARRALAVLVWNETGRLPRIRARRTDNGQWIGSRAPGFPLFAAYADRWSSIWLEIDTDRLNPGTDIRMLAFSGQENPSPRLFAEAIGRTLSLLRHESVPIDRIAAIEAGRWLRDALGVTWTSRDLADVEIQDPQLAALLREIGTTTGGRP